ncbi:putative pentatricopeptide repeat-containing protein, mitochondrial [Heracleum sosnowskyi]|uniref:Pentatricopeptide repeat-containing protein, mitochondrial n=1 Tax=Heracleum sosnowskyi TaxID=360622 RepID=A0AAD8IIG6_9APIA|nr:putative pentatricopeptide repeat-containing protein, mitochondrial [Heracleum sosnowskyi]
MTLMSVSSRFCSFLLRRRLGTTYSCSGFELLSSSSSIGLVHFHSHTNLRPKYNVPHSTHISNSHIKLRHLLLQKSKSGFEKLDDALVVFDKMLKMRPLPNVIDFAQLLTALVVMKQYPVAVSLFRDICTLRIPVSIITLSIVINCCCHSNRLDYAFSLFASIFKRGFVPNVVTYTTLIRGLLSQHKSAEARLLFTNLIKLKELQPNVVTYSTMINGLCKTGHIDMALWLFRFMGKSDSPPNTVTYTAIIDSLCKRGLADDALNLHSEMMEKGILPNVWTYSPIFQVLCNFNRWEEVSLLLKQMIEDMKISPNVYTFNILVDAYSKSGKLDDAKEIIEMMNERGEYPNIVTYSTLMQAYCAEGQIDEALAVLDRIKIKEIRPDCCTYNILLDAYCRRLQLDIAMDLYRNMVAEGLEPTVETHRVLLNGLCRLGKPMEALNFLYKIQDQGHMLDIVIYHTMLTGLCKNQYVHKALSLFHLMSCNGVIPDRDTYNIIIRGCLRNKKFSEACKLVEKMVDCGFLADAATTFLLQQLLSKVQDPSLLALHQKCLHSGIQEEFHGLRIPKPIHISCPAENSMNQNLLMIMPEEVQLCKS